MADWAFALPTAAFFLCTIGTFIIGYVLTKGLATSRSPGPSIWRRAIAATRYLSYRGFRIKALEWNSAPIGVLLLGAIGTIFFFCTLEADLYLIKRLKPDFSQGMDLIPSPYYWPGTDTVWGNSPPLGTRSGWLAIACMPFLLYVQMISNLKPH